MCVRIRLGRGRALQEGPIFSPSSPSQINGPGQGDLGEKIPGNLGDEPGILPLPGSNITDREEEIELPDISTPPPRIFHNFSSPPIPTPMISSSSNNIATKMPDLINRDRRNSAGIIFTRL